MLKVYRRNLPHWRLEDATYFVTWRLDRTRRDLAPWERDLVVNALRYFDGTRYQLLAYVVMNDHVHSVIAPGDGMGLERIVQAWKSYTAHRLPSGETGRVWQSEYQDRIVRSEAELRQKIEYVLSNPFSRWPMLTVYPWAWARGIEES
jgi:REP-associated tyrosine transposase